MIFREAKVEDIYQMQTIRNSVNENVLSDPNKVTYADYHRFITQNGKGWVCEIENKIVGFAIVDLVGHNIWALFLNHEFEKKGIGYELHRLMLDWYFSKTKTTVWLSTTANTRAAYFYRQAGWLATGSYGEDEIKFEMPYEIWAKK